MIPLYDSRKENNGVEENCEKEGAAHDLIEDLKFNGEAPEVRGQCDLQAYTQRCLTRKKKRDREHGSMTSHLGEVGLRSWGLVFACVVFGRITFP